jgi:hypothetical protein
VLLRCVLHECGGQGLVLRQLMQEQVARLGQQGLPEQLAALEPPRLGRPAELGPALVAVQGPVLPERVLPERQTGQLAEQLAERPVWQPGS